MDETFLDYFEGERLEKFVDAVNEGLGQFGADNQDVFDSFELAAGLPVVEMLEFPTEPLALACRDEPVAEWERICCRMIDRWVTGGDQLEWIAAQPFADIAGRLRPWLSNEREIMFNGAADGPRQPWTRELLPGCWLSLFVDVPSLGQDMPAYSTFVHNEAVAAWGVSYEDLLAATNRRLRSLRPPKWQSNLYPHLDENDETTYRIEMSYVEESEETDPIPAVWQLILPEVAPRPLVPGTLIASPTRHVLMLSYPDPALTFEQRKVVFERWADRVWGNYPQMRVQGWSLRVEPDDVWRIVEDDAEDPTEG